MHAVLAALIGLMVGCAVYLLLQPRVAPVVYGLLLLTYGVNLLVFAAGGVMENAAPLLTVTSGEMSDPLPHALVLTAIVIGLGMTAFVLALTLRAFSDAGTDHVDGEEPPP